MSALLFPGQGSQRKGMGAALFDEVAEYRAVESQVDRLLGYSLRELCISDARNQLKETQFTQPSLYVVNALHYYRTRSQGVMPKAVAGHSLGEYNALLSAGAFDFLTGLRMVQKRGELMARAKEGGMSAVIGLSEARITQVLAANHLSRVDVANINSPSQIVISGPLEDLKVAGPIFESAGARMYVPLQVSAAFHSRYMAPAARAFEEFLGEFSFNSPRIPVISNVTAEPYPDAEPTGSIRALLVRQITHAVRWSDSIRFLMAEPGMTFKELGPGNVLTKLLEQIQQAS